MSLDGVVQAPGHASEDSEDGFVHGVAGRGRSWALGSGKRLFDHHDRHRGPVELRFVDSTVTGGGLVILTYERT
jgi:hypothetical protein